MKEKMEKEGSILRLSVFLSAIYVIAELIMTITSHSQSMLVDFTFGIAEFVITVIITFLLPLIYKPVTEKRPYGYSQVESLLVILKGVSIAIITAILIKDNIQIILEGGSEVSSTKLMIYEIILGFLCTFSFFVLKRKSKKIKTPVVNAEFVEWKIDMYTTASMFVAFLGQYILERTEVFNFFAPYIDSVFALIISVIMIKEPIEMVIKSFRQLVLFAPEKQTVDKIKKIVDKKIAKYPYDVTFYDVVKTGRKIWIELYIKSEQSELNLKELKKAKKEVEDSLRKHFDEIYVEFTPEI